MAQCVWAEDPSDALANSLNESEPAGVRKMTVPNKRAEPLDRWGVGVAYTGAQARLNLTPRAAMEARYQRGSADSQYGRVTAQVFGLRGYRFLRPDTAWPFYWGLEGAYATAKPQTSSYKTSGIAAGGFGGIEYRHGRHFAVDADAGPYVISLKEQRTNTHATNVDFVINTAVLVFIF